MALITAAILGLAALTSAVIANTVVPRSQTENEEWQSSEAEINRQFQSTEAATARQFNAEQADIARQFSAEEAEKSRAFSAEEAQKQRDYEKMMSDTSVQRQVADMKAAGINPASIGLLGGASTPTGATASAAQAASFGANASNGPSGSMVSGGPVNTGYMMNLYNSAVQAVMAKDKNFTNQSIAEMYATNSRQMRTEAELIRKTAYDYRTDQWKRKNLEEFAKTKTGQQIMNMGNDWESL